MKADKKTNGVSQRHLYSRISYLYQAATHLMNARPEEGLGTTPTTTKNTFLGPEPSQAKDNNQDINVEAPEISQNVSHSSITQCSTKAYGPSRHLISQLRSVSLKGQIRLSPTMKHSICKRCDALLVPGRTSSTHIENKSRGGKKPWADVLVVTCHACSAVKRFPVEAKRQSRRPLRAGRQAIKQEKRKLRNE